jgi:hypothetical protein
VSFGSELRKKEWVANGTTFGIGALVDSNIRPKNADELPIGRGIFLRRDSGKIAAKRRKGW